jgi:hypothetical protein
MGGVAAEQHSMLSPLTPQAQQQQHYQQRQQGPYQQQQASELVMCSADCTGSFGVSWDSCSMGRLDGLPLDVPHTTSQFVQPAGPRDCGLDLHSLRQYSNIVAQACLHCDVPGVSAGACAGSVASSCMLSCPYTMAGDIPMVMPASMMGPSAGFSGVSGNESVGGVPVAADLQSAGLAAAGGAGQGLPATEQYSYSDDQQRQQHEQHMRSVAETAASVYRSSDGGGSVALRSSCTGCQDGALPAWQPGSLPSSWDFTHYASAQTAAVAAAASSAFGTSSGGTDGLGSLCWGGGVGALTSSGFLTASKSIW